MKAVYQIPEPILFNPMKHHLGFIKEFIQGCPPAPLKGGVFFTGIKHIGTTVMDIYTGNLTVSNICDEIIMFLSGNDLEEAGKYSFWTGITYNKFKIIKLSDDSLWTMKYQNDPMRFVHIFPARYSLSTIRVKGNTLKSALIYLILIGKDLVTGEDLNKVRPLLGLSPIKNALDAATIVEMIEILRG